MRAAILLAALALAACGSEQPETPPETQLALQPLGAPEFEQYEIELGGCAFAPEGRALSAVLITDRDKAYLKTNDTVAPLAKAEGSSALPGGAWSAYSGGGYSVSLTISGEGKPQGSAKGYPAHLVVRDGSGATVYDSEGMAQCGA